MKKYLFTLCLLTMFLRASANYLVITPDLVNVTPDGMFVMMNGLSVPVESINAANDGFLVAIPRPNAAICPSCGRDGYTPGRFCDYCGFPDDAKKTLINAIR